MPTPRETFELAHSAWLAPCAIRECECGGRKVPEADHPYRTCFQRDRDRVMHCSAFRRLDFKTQVFVPHEQDHSRTRMTHTLEVAQIGRSVARALRLNEDLVETVALAHDLGHSPFGHGGEAVLDGLMKEHDGFEHNRQSLRVVDYLEHPYPRFRGLNLTQAVRECLAKHRTRYDQPVCPEFDAALQAPLEGQLVDLADEIAYTSADLEDALAAAWLDLDQVSGLALWRRAWAIAEADAPDARAIHKRIRACKAVLATMADDAIATTAALLAGRNFDSPDAVRHAGAAAAGFSPTIAAEVHQMQDFLLKEVYVHPRSADKERQTRSVITGLFEAFRADPSRLPGRYQARVAADGLHRVICDYIAGMTDRYCLQEYAKLRKE